MAKQNSSRNKAVTILLIAVIWIIAVWFKFLYTPIVTDQFGMQYTIPEGTSIRAVIDDLYAKNVVEHPNLFKILVIMKGAVHKLRAGDYLFPKGSTPSSILKQITTGTGMIYHAFTIVPGWNFKELRAALQHDDSFHHTIQYMSDDEIMKQLGHPELKPEGEFFPDTYYTIANSDDFLILKRSFKAMQTKLMIAWQHRASGLPFKTPYEALIGASIIEKEAYLQTELPMMAGVMVNRLRSGMLLQFDPTVIYGMGDQYNGTIHHSDLIANDNPYNTYTHKGLPPTPISMPSLAAMEAIMHPTQHDFYYFVAQGDRSSLFTKRLTQHYEAVEIAKKSRWFFNIPLARYYLLKQFSQNNTYDF